MHSTLSKIIRGFRRAQDRAVSTLRDDFHLPMPQSNRDWLKTCIDLILHYKQAIQGIGIYTHGFGVELTHEGMIIDFDWGDKGEPNGFDIWRLWNHCKENSLYLDECSYEAIASWISDAFQKGELRKDTSLYYFSSDS